MADREEIIETFGRIGIAGDVIVMSGIYKGFDATGQHLVHVALVRHVEYDFVGRGVKYVVQGYCRLEEAQVGTDMAAMTAQLGDQRGPQVIGQRGQLGDCQTLDVCRRFDILDIHVVCNGFMSLQI